MEKSFLPGFIKKQCECGKTIHIPKTTTNLDPSYCSCGRPHFVIIVKEKK